MRRSVADRRVSETRTWWLALPVPARLAIILGLGLLVRLALIPVGGYGSDLRIMREWGSRLLTEPMSRFYATDEVVDHLPGDLWLLWLLGHAADLMSPGARLPNAALKLVPVLADLGLGGVLFLIGQRLAGPRTGLVAAGFIALNPALIFLSAIWGQWDAVSALLAMVALWLLLRGDLPWALPALAWAILIKPQFAAWLPLFMVAIWHGGGLSPGAGRTRLWRGLLGTANALLLAALLLLPFDVGIGPMATTWDLIERLRYSLDYYPETTLNAFNLWATSLAGNRESDAQLLLGVAVRVWGTLLFVAAYLLILVRLWRWPSTPDVVWALFAVSFTSFMLPTRIHERYLLPAVVLAALVAALAPRCRWFAVALSFTYLANIYWSYDKRYLALEIDSLYDGNLFIYEIALLNVGLLAFALTRLGSILHNSGSSGGLDGLPPVAGGASEVADEIPPVGCGRPPASSTLETSDAGHGPGRLVARTPRAGRTRRTPGSRAGCTRRRASVASRDCPGPARRAPRQRLCTRTGRLAGNGR